MVRWLDNHSKIIMCVGTSVHVWQGYVHDHTPVIRLVLSTNNNYIVHLHRVPILTSLRSPPRVALLKHRAVD